MIAALRFPRFYGAAAARAFDGYLAAQSFAPEMLGLRALYDHRGSSATKIVDLSGNGRADATVGAGSNSPLWLPYAAPTFYMPAVAGNRISCLSNPGASATQIDVRGASNIAAYPSGTQWWYWGAGAGTAADTHFRFGLLNSGAYYLDISDGTTLSTYITSTVVTAPLGMYCHRVTWDGTAGLTRFWYKATTEQAALLDMLSNAGWTQCGPDRTYLPGVVANPNTTPVNVGIFGTSNLLLEGRQYGLSVATTIDGTPKLIFDPATCTQTTWVPGGTVGGTSPTISRAVAGRKAVVQSPAANSARGVWLFGTDDWIDVPAAATPPMDTYAAQSSFVVVFRSWNVAASRAVYTTKPSNVNTSLGFAFRTDATAYFTYLGDGALVDGTNATTPLTGARIVAYNSGGNTSPFVRVVLNGIETGTDIARGTAGTTSTAGASRLGAFTGGTGAMDMEFEALLTADRVLTASELAQIIAFYGGGQ